jgi:hypothetical protein
MNDMKRFDVAQLVVKRLHVTPFDVMLRRLVLAASCATIACSSSGPGDDADTVATPALGAGGTGSSPIDPNAAAAGAVEPTPSPRPGAGMPVVEVPVPMDVVLDDFDDNDGELSLAGFSGSWRTYSDGTGTVTPAVDTPVVPVDGAVHVMGSGFATGALGSASISIRRPGSDSRSISPSTAG